MLNRVVLIGRTTKQPELKETSNGNKHTEFTLAVDRQFKNADGSRSTDFLRCVAWRKTAEIIAKYVAKGDMVAVEGRIETNMTQDVNGFKSYYTKIVVDNVSLISSKQNKQAGQQGNQQGYQQNSQNYQQNDNGLNFDSDPLGNISNDPLMGRSRY